MQGIVWHTQKYQDDNIFYQKTCENIAQHFQDNTAHTQLPPKNTRQRIIEKKSLPFSASLGDHLRITMGFYHLYVVGVTQYGIFFTILLLP